MLGRRHVAAILLTVNGTRAASAQFHASVGVGLTWGRGPAADSPLSLPELTAISPGHSERAGVRKVMVLLHIATRNPSSALLDDADVDSLLAMLRAIEHQSGVRVVSVCAFNLDQEKVLFDQSVAADIDLDGLRSGIRSLRPGTIDYSLLVARSAGTGAFLGELLTRKDAEQPDAVVILGSLANRPAKPRRASPEASAAFRPVFYLRYAAGPNLYLWNDAIRDIVHARKGGLYDIHQPADFWRAWTAIESALGLGSNK